jgi:carbon monoxide dehydrogenase subunit G
VRFETQFSVPGDPAEVLRRFEDVPTVATFLPGASVGPPNADGSFPATLVVSFGPKRIAFKGTVTNKVDHAALAGVLRGTASADMRAARMAVTMNYALSAATQAPRPDTLVRIVSDADLTGVLAQFASTGGVAVTETLLAEFSRRFAAAYEMPAAPTSTSPAQTTPPAPLPAPALSAWQLLRAVIARIFRGWWRKA